MEMQYMHARSKLRSSGAGIWVMILLIGLAIIVAPFFLPGLTGAKIGWAERLLFWIFGASLFIFALSIITFTKWYHKTSANEAFVRTGAKGQRAIINGGQWLFLCSTT